MKLALKIFIAAVLFFGLEKFIRIQTRGFRIDKTTAEYAYNPAWEIQGEVPEVLNQKFYFLGSGAQTYSFIGEDKTTVLKLFKHYHCYPNSRVLRKIPYPGFASKWKEKVLNHREERIAKIFDSAVLAYRDLPEETKILHLKINSTQNQYPTIVLYDKIGVRYSVDLNQAPFVLQKKAELIYTYIDKHPDEAKKIIDSFFACLRTQTQHRISNRDYHIGRNFGVYEGKVIQFDIGSYFQNETHTPQDIGEFKNWIIKNRPDLETYFNESI